jgi:hypothetical protein
MRLVNSFEKERLVELIKLFKNTHAKLLGVAIILDESFYQFSKNTSTIDE